MNIQIYTNKQLQDCRKLWEELTQHHRDIYNDQTIGGENPGLYFDKHLKQVGEENIFIAIKDGIACGMLGLMTQAGFNEDSIEVEPVVIKKEYRGKGIAKELVNKAIEVAKQRGYKYINVKPLLRNQTAVKFYHKVGFKTLGVVEMFIDLDKKNTSEWKKTQGIGIFNLDFEY